MLEGLIILWVVVAFYAWDQGRLTKRIVDLEVRIKALEEGTTPSKWPQVQS